MLQIQTMVEYIISIGYLIIDPPTPNIPDKNEPINPRANMTIINMKSIVFPSF